MSSPESASRLRPPALAVRSQDRRRRPVTPAARPQPQAGWKQRCSREWRRRARAGRAWGLRPSTSDRRRPKNPAPDRLYASQDLPGSDCLSDPMKTASKTRLPHAVSVSGTDPGHSGVRTKSGNTTGVCGRAWWGAPSRGLAWGAGTASQSEPLFLRQVLSLEPGHGRRQGRDCPQRQAEARLPGQAVGGGRGVRTALDQSLQAVGGQSGDQQL